YGFARALWAWAVDRPLVGFNMWTVLVTGFGLAAVAVGSLSVATDGLRQLPPVVRLFTYGAVAFVGLLLGVRLDTALGRWQYRLYLWLLARRLPLYREQLTAPDAEARLRAADRLATLGPYARPALSDLLAVLRDASADVREAAVRAVLYVVGDPPPEDDTETPKAARAALADPDVRVRVCAAAILVRFRAVLPEEVLPVLREGVVRTGEDCAFTAAQALEKLGP